MAKTVTFTDITTPTSLNCVAIPGGTLAANTTYYYKVIAVMNSGVVYTFNGKSLPSNEASATTTAINKSITLTFNFPKGEVSSYRVWRTTSPIGAGYNINSCLNAIPTDSANNVGGIVTWTDTGVALASNCILEQYTHGYITLGGSTSTNKFSIIDLYNADVGNGWGMVKKINDTTYQCFAFIYGHVNMYWYDYSKTIIFQDGFNFNYTGSNVQFGYIIPGTQRTNNGCNIEVATSWLIGTYFPTLNAYRTIFKYTGYYQTYCFVAGGFDAGLIQDCQMEFWRTFTPSSSANCTIKNFICNTYDNLFSNGAALFINIRLLGGTRVFQLGANQTVYAKGVYSEGNTLGLVYFIGQNIHVTLVDSIYDYIGSCAIDSTGSWVKDKFSYNLKVTSAEDGSPINGANVKIYDAFNNLICNVNTNSNGEIAEQELLRKQYDIVIKTITSIEYTPYKNVISAPGYKDYIEFTSYSASDPLKKTISLTPPVYVDRHISGTIATKMLSGSIKIQKLKGEISL